MARVVDVDFYDELVKIRLLDEHQELQVHKHLLSERSDKFKTEVEEAMAKESGKFYGWCQIWLNTNAASMYLGFLYGQPMCTRPSDRFVERCTDSDWFELIQVLEMSMGYEDHDAIDACLDGMRNLLENCRDALDDPFEFCAKYMGFDTPHGRLIVDYMVHRDCKFRKWMETYNRSELKESFEEEEEGLDQALSKKFAEEARRKEAGLDEPDLMARCRYHLHVEKSLPCYLDK